MRSGGLFLVLASVFIGLSNLFSSAAQATTRVEVNIFYPGSAWNITALNNFQTDLDVKFTAAKWYMNWSTSFETAVAQRFHSNGYIPEMTWEPSLSGGAGVKYQDVVDGDYDSYITQTAIAIKNLGFPIRISLGPEMNATWTPWGGQSGNNPTNFKAFWRHTVDKFRANGATNVQWIWSPNVIPYGSERVGSYAEMFPGNSYVDYLGLDGYNWGTSQSWSEWQSFRQVFLASYNEIKAVSSKGILIMETASTELGGNKAAWITDMFKELQTSFPQVKGFTWFHIKKETDWRIDSSASAKAAFSAGYQSGGTTPAPSLPPKTSPSVSGTAEDPENSVTDPETTIENSADKTTPKKLTPADFVINEPIKPKIAGTYYQYEPTPITDPNKLGLFGSLLIGGTIMGQLFRRRFKLIHSEHLSDSPVATIRPTRHNKIDGVQPKRK